MVKATELLDNALAKLPTSEVRLEKLSPMRNMLSKETRSPNFSKLKSALKGEKPTLVLENEIEVPQNDQDTIVDGRADSAHGLQQPSKVLRTNTGVNVDVEEVEDEDGREEREETDAATAEKGEGVGREGTKETLTSTYDRPPRDTRAEEGAEELEEGEGSPEGS